MKNEFTAFETQGWVGRIDFSGGTGIYGQNTAVGKFVAAAARGATVAARGARLRPQYHTLATRASHLLTTLTLHAAGQRIY